MEAAHLLFVRDPTKSSLSTNPPRSSTGSRKRLRADRESSSSRSLRLLPAVRHKYLVSMLNLRVHFPYQDICLFQIERYPSETKVGYISVSASPATGKYVHRTIYASL
jgi:hypothetical protein